MLSGPLPTGAITGARERDRAVGDPYLLVVDDDPDVRTLLRIVLAKMGCQVRESHSGAQALDLARRRPPDAMLVDLWMPGMSGADVVHTMGTDPELAGIPVIVATGDTEASAVPGAFATVTKPFNLDRLRRTVWRAIGSRLPGN